MQQAAWKGLLVVALALLGGCATLSETPEKIEAVAKVAADGQKRMVQAASSAAVTRSPLKKIAAEEIVLRDRNELPAKFGEKVVYVGYSEPVQSVLATLSQQIGLPILLTQSPPAAAASGSSMPPGQPAGTGNAFQLEWRSGTLKALLDHVAQRLRMHWRYRDGRVEFLVTETRSFHVYLPVGDKKIAASIALSGAGSGSAGAAGAGASGGSSGGADSVSVTSNMVIDPYGAITKTINAMLNDAGTSAGPSTTGAPQPSGAAQGAAGAARGASSSSGSGNVVANPELGMITVTASPPLLDRVADYIDSINKRFAANIMIDVRVYAVTTKREAGAGFSLTALLNTLGRYGLSITGATPLQTDGTAGRMTIDHSGSNSHGSLLVSALSQFGDVALARSGQVMAVNGQPAPMQLADEITYLASSATTQTANVGATTTLTPGSRTVGFTANFLPMLLGDNRILLQYQISLSSLLSMSQVSSNGSTIQTPSISTQSLQQQAFVRDGQSIVLFGFESDRNATDTATGIGSLSSTASRQRNLLVIVMQVFGGSRDET